ncbi:hypothetical protein FB451DRAFT_1393268 [Mycena latifolia]|nr:hypothetical protein FB451DRAFT_1393268 [Mycena latifolia]
MVARPEMERVARAIDSLKKASSKHKSDAIQTAIGELSSILSLLNLSSSNKVLNRLTKIFRDNLEVLYTAFPVLMFQFCAAVLGVIFTEKIEPAGDFAVQHSWETVMKSVVSSILDFLDQSPSARQRPGTRCTSTICDIFYPRATSFKWTSPILIFNVNLLLTETATNHPENQSRLRSDKVLGASRIAFAVSQSKDFFAIDSLLALIGVLLPARKTASKRTEFVDAVFTPSLFSCSPQIKRLIAASSNTDWDPVIPQIVNELAKSDISFPQPFYVSGLRTSTPLPNIVDPLYVDRLGLFANIEQEGGLFDSYQVRYTSMERIKLSMPGAFTTPVTVQLASAPLIGAASEADTPEDQKQKCSMLFQLKNADAARFLEALKARGLGKLISNETDRKVSKLAESLNLEFDPSQQKPATQQEKVAKVEQLWQSNGDGGLGEPTSPLVAHSAKEQHASSESRSDLREASWQHDAIDGDDLSDVSDGEKTISKAKSSVPPSTKAKSPASRPRVRIVLDSDDEDAIAVPQPRTAHPRKSAMKKLAVESDEEDIPTTQSPPSTNVMDQDFEPTQPEAELAATVPARVTRGAAARKNLTVATSIDEPRKTVSGRAKASRDVPAAAADVPEPVRSIRRPANAKRAAPVDDHLSEDEIETTTKLAASSKKISSKADQGTSTDSRPNGKGNTTSATKDKTEVTSKPTDEKNTRKRTKADQDQDVSDEDEDASDRPPTKRLRGIDAAPEESVPPAVPRRVSAAIFGARSVNPAPVKRRYGGKKGRTSSPVPDATDPDTAMAVDYDELPAPPSPAPAPVPEKVAKAAKQEAGADTRKSRVAAMKGKAGQKPEPATKAPPKSTKAAPSEKQKTEAPVPAAKDDMDKENVEMEPESEVIPLRRSTRTAKDNAAPKPAEPLMDIPITKPKAKPQKPKKAPWEDMHLKKKNDAVPSSDEPSAEIHLKKNDAIGPPYSNLPPVPDDDVTMIDLTQDVPPKAKTLQLVLPTLVLPDPHPVDLTSPFPQIKSIHVLPEVKSKSAAVVLKSSSAKVVDTTTPIRQQARSSPVAPSEPAPPLPVTKFKSEVPPRPIQPTSFLQKPPSQSPVRPSKLPTPPPAKKPSPPRPVRARKAATPPPPSPQARTSTPPRQSRPAPPSRQITSDSPFPERVYQTVAFAQSRASPSPSVRTNGQFIPVKRTAKNHEPEHTPELGRPVRANFGRGQHKYEGHERDHDYKRSKSPMQGILEILNEIQEVVVEKISQRFDHVRKDVRVGRDGILRRAAANLEAMCTESEGHFNTLVDLEEDYAGYHRKIILSLDDMHKSSEVMANALGQIIQHHDRRSLSKKLPTKLFTLPSIVRNPVLSL